MLSQLIEGQPNVFYEFSPWSEGWSSCRAVGRPWRRCRSVAQGQDQWGPCPRARWRRGQKCRSRTPSWRQIRSSVEVEREKVICQKMRRTPVGLWAATSDRPITIWHASKLVIQKYYRYDMFCEGVRKTCSKDAAGFVCYWLGACSTLCKRRFTGLQRSLSFGIFCVRSQEYPAGCACL